MVRLIVIALVNASAKGTFLQRMVPGSIRSVYRNVGRGPIHPVDLLEIEPGCKIGTGGFRRTSLQAVRRCAFRSVCSYKVQKIPLCHSGQRLSSGDVGNDIQIVAGFGQDPGAELASLRKIPRT